MRITDKHKSKTSWRMVNIMKIISQWKTNDPKNANNNLFFLPCVFWGEIWPDIFFTNFWVFVSLHLYKNRHGHMGYTHSRDGGPHVALFLLNALVVTVALGKSPLCLHFLKLWSHQWLLPAAHQYKYTITQQKPWETFWFTMSKTDEVTLH